MAAAENNHEFDVYHLYNVFRKRIGLFVGIVISGIFLSFLVNLSMVDKYRTNIFATSTVLENHESAQLISQLQTIVDKNDVETLSRVMNLPKDTVDQLTNVKAIPSEEEPHNFELQIKTTSSASILPLLQGIRYYVRNTDYANRLKSVQQKSLERIVQDFDRVLKKIDSIDSYMKGAIARKDELPNTLIISNIYSDYSQVRQKLETNRQELELLSIINYYNEPYISDNPTSPKLAMNLIIGFIIALVLATFWIVLLAMIEYFKTHQNQNFTS